MHARLMAHEFLVCDDHNVSGDRSPIAYLRWGTYVGTGKRERSKKNETDSKASLSPKRTMHLPSLAPATRGCEAMFNVDMQRMHMHIASMG